MRRMDKRLKINVSSGSWTNEKHVQFLNWVEASFVRTTFEGSSSNRRLLPLNRYIPDSSESTQDLKSQRKKKLHPPGDDIILALIHIYVDRRTERGKGKNEKAKKLSKRRKKSIKKNSANR